MLRKLMLASVSTLAFCSAAAAADMPVKAAPPPNPFLTYNGSGPYWAVGTSAGVADTSANGNLLIGNLLSSNVNAAGAGIDLEVGWIWGNASAIGFLNWYRVYASATYQNISGGVVTNSAAGPASIGVVSRWQAQQGFDVNADLFNYVFATFGWKNPFPAFTPQPPSNLALATVPHQYVGAFVQEIGVGGNFGPSTTGGQVVIAPGARTGFIWQTLDATGKPNGAAFDTGVQVSWAQKGVELSNVFATNGAPVSVHSSLDMTTRYGVYAHLAF